MTGVTYEHCLMVTDFDLAFEELCCIDDEVKLNEPGTACANLVDDINGVGLAFDRVKFTDEMNFLAFFGFW